MSLTSGKLFFLFLIVNCALHIENSLCQVSQEWVARYNNQGNGSIHKAYSLAVDGQGNVYVTGRSFGSDTIYDYATIKYNSAGIQQWVQRYNGPGNGDDEAYSIAVDGFGNVYVTGFSVGSGTSYDYATIKYNSAGVEEWVQRYNGPGNSFDWANALAVDSSGNIYVTGFSVGSGTNNDFATIKYNSAGVQQWVQRYNGPGNSGDWANALAVDSSGNVYVTGSSWGVASWDDYTTVKYNSAGVEEWVQRYNGTGNEVDIAYSIAVDGSGNVYVTGWSWGGEQYSSDYATIKYNSAGEELWVRRYNEQGSSTDRAYTLALDISGNVYVTGYCWFSANGPDYATVKYKPNGELQWARRYNGPGNGDDWAFSLAVDGYGNVYVTGRSDGIGTNYDYATVKYNTSGVQQWVQRYTLPGLGIDEGLAIKVDGKGNVYVTGFSQGEPPFYVKEYATIKYSQPIGITPISNEVPKDFRLEQNYPNPFNPVTNIKFTIKENTRVSLKVYDITGKLVSTLVNNVLDRGEHSIIFDGSNFASGIYYYQLITFEIYGREAEFIDTRKMVLIK